MWPWALGPAGDVPCWSLSPPMPSQERFDCTPCDEKIDAAAFVVLEMFIGIPVVEEARSDIG
jgi:hypothetical protein